MQENNPIEPSVRITRDEMEAFLFLPPRKADEEYTVQELVDFLAKKGIRYGIDQELLLRMVKEGLYNQELLIAKGEPVVNGIDGAFKFNFSVNFSNKPAVCSDGTVDYWSIHAVEVVEEGQVIASYTDPVEGQNGMTVTGKARIAKRGKALPPLTGRGFERSEDNRIYTATTSGKIEKQGNRIQILPIYELYGNVDLHTGRIDFRGDVIIHGNVTPGSRINATGSVTIDGISESCFIEAGKDIILRGGLLGGNKAKLKAKGNIIAKFIEYAKVEAEGFIEASSSLNSTLVSYDKIYMNETNSTIVGGSVYGTRGMEITSVGNSSETKTEICVGVHKDIAQKYYSLEKNINDTLDMIAKLDSGIAQFDELSATTGRDFSKDERRVALFRTKIVKQAELAADKIEYEHLKMIVERSANASIRVTKEVYGNVNVAIDDYKITTKDEYKGVEFMGRNGQVVMMSIL